MYLFRFGSFFKQNFIYAEGIIISQKSNYKNMGKYKINSPRDNEVFVVTESYRRLCEQFKNLKISRGRIIHVIGSPGTGKSANIYAAIEELGLNVYDAQFRLKNIDASYDEAFKQIFRGMEDDLKVSKAGLYEKLSNYDAVLFADSFHDSHLKDIKMVGFSKWSNRAGFKAGYFYLMCLMEYFKHRKSFKRINIVFQTAWRIRVAGKKIDIFSDLGVFSRFILVLLGIFFIVVRISYTTEETQEIIKKHGVSDDKCIQKCIEKYGNKPRCICQAFENKKC